MALARRWSVALAAIFCVLSAEAHLVSGARSLHERVAEADLVVRARVVGATALAARSSDEPGIERPFVEIEVLEVLKGDPVGDTLRFVQHGHGVADFEPDREYLIFLIDVVRSRELDVLAETGSIRWLSLQEHDGAYPLESASRKAVLAATRAYVSAEAAGSAVARAGFLRSGTRSLLTSGDPRASASAIRDLVGAPRAGLLIAEDVVVLAPVLDDPATSIGVRVALLAELERRGLLDGEPRWLGLLADDAPAADRVVAIRAAGNDPRPAVRERLLVLLGDDRDEVAAAAAAALGRPGDTTVVPPLTAALAHDSARVRGAAIRGLGATRTEAALRALERAGESHPDPDTRRLAGAEARKRRAALAASSAGKGG